MGCRRLTEGPFSDPLPRSPVLPPDTAAATEQACDVLEGSDKFRTMPYDVPEARSPGLFDGLAGIGYVLLRLGAADDLPCVLAWE